MLQWLSDILLEDNTLPTHNYDTKKILCPMGMDYQKIHACLNNCVLYKNEFAKLRQCSQCEVSRYKLKEEKSKFDNKGPLAKVLWYLPRILWLKHLFSNTNYVKLMR